MLSVNLLPGADSAASAIQAEKVRMEVISQNIANANTTSTPQGGPYQRQVVRFETVMKTSLMLPMPCKKCRWRVLKPMFGLIAWFINLAIRMLIRRAAW